MPLKHLTLACFAAALTIACAAHDDGDPTEPEVTPKVEVEQPEVETPKPPPIELAKVSISSVQMLKDCPDPPPPAKPSAAKRAPADESRGASATPGFAPSRRRCEQSTMQVSFMGQGDKESKVVVKEVRVIAADMKVLDTIAARKPTAWQRDTYEPWDETLEPKTDIKASYKLSAPNWSRVERRLGKQSSFGPTFRLEVDVEIDGQRQTVLSPEFVREREHVMVT